MPEIEIYKLLSYIGFALVAYKLLSYTIRSLIMAHKQKKSSRLAYRRIKGGPRDFHYVTPSQAKARGDTRSLEELKALSKREGDCFNCGSPIWKYADTDLCFPCTTGESDASDDLELVPEPGDTNGPIR